MIPLTLAEVAAATGGTLQAADPGVTITGLAIDSRTVRPGDLFAALRGEHTDGARFAPDAVAAGAAAVLTRPATTPDLPRVEVADPLTALAATAAAVRDRSRARVLAVTGSAGKTTTKDLLAGVLATSMSTVAARNSFNTETGLPLTLARLEPDTEALVLEMGARGIGHIAALCRTAHPEIGIITNVGVAHIGMFGSQAAIARAKGELVEALPPDGTAILNADDELVAAMTKRTRARIVGYGLRPGADVRATDVTLDGLGRASFRLVTPAGDVDVSLPTPGEHMVPNALAAAAAGWVLGVGPEETAKGLATAALSPARMQVTRRTDGVTIINDAYNANPASMAAGLKALRVARPAGGRAIAVLGEMAELGDIAEAEHDRIGRLLVRLGIDRVVGIGPLGRVIVHAARQEGIFEPADAVAVADQDEALAVLGDLRAGDVVLVKASLAVGLRRLAGTLADDPGRATGGGGH